MKKLVKDPAAVLDYTWDWSDFLQAGEAIESHTLVTDNEAVTVESSAHDATTVTGWLAGGTHELRVLVTCAIVTTEDREDERSAYLLVLNQ